jgi:hypothetical protein
VPDSRTCYQAYLLRLWRGDEGSPWRASLVPVGAEQQIHFSALEDLLGFLREQAGQAQARAGDLQGQHREGQSELRQRRSREGSSSRTRSSASLPGEWSENAH